MTDNDQTEVCVEEVMRTIQAEASRLRNADGVCPEPDDSADAVDCTNPKPIAIDPGLVRPPLALKEDGYHVNDFLKFHDRDFIRNAYRGILKREPDPEGFPFWLDRLRTGEMTKIQILQGLRLSPEGHTKGVRVRRLRLYSLLQSSYKIPLFGPLIQFVATILNFRTILRNIHNLDVYMQARLYDLTDQVSRAFRVVENSMNEIVMAKADRSDLELKADARLAEELMETKAERSDFESLRFAHEGAMAALQELALAKADRIVKDLARTKADRAELASLTPSEAVDEREAAILAEISKNARDTLSLRRSLVDQERRLRFFLEDARKDLGESCVTNHLARVVAEEDHLLDAFYASFEDEFRGTREEIKHKLEIYLPYLLETGAGFHDKPALDLGCGRGEWLELLRANDLKSVGVDNNAAMASYCREYGIDIVQEDVLDFLRRQDPCSFGAVSGFHLLEHLPLPKMIQVLDEAFRVLAMGGLIIFETPNPNNIMVGASSFYLDPTHRNPIHPSSLRFMAELRGFAQVKTITTNPAPTHCRIADQDSELARRFNELFYGEQDYAIIGYKK